MLDFPLPEIHKMATKHHDWNSNNQKSEAEAVQQRMKLCVQQPTGRKHETNRKGKDGAHKTRERGRQFPGDRLAFDSFAHKSNLRYGA